MTRTLSSLCVFCGSSVGDDPAFAASAVALGKVLAAANVTLVFGGGRVGMMGALADATVAAGGKAIGVIPKHLLAREIAHGGLTELRVVDSMHERKAMMADLADAFVALPGGLGTLEELFEVWTWGQLGLHRKPYALLNVNGFFDPLVAFIDQLVRQRFVRAAHRGMLIVERDPDLLLQRLGVQYVPTVPKLLDDSSL